MDYKEKLKLAKEALDSGSYDKETIEYIFPELAESEEIKDERIRKYLITYFSGIDDSASSLKGKDVVAWLEKRDQTFTKKDIDDAYLKGICDAKRELEKQDEPTDIPADTIRLKPKFKVGDWVVQGCIILKIRCVGDERYCYETVGGYVDDMLVSEINSLYHLWTIKDAKDGDVLTCDDEDKVFIYNGKLDLKGRVCAYCGIYKAYNELRFTECAIGNYFTYKEPHPATKEQRALLFQGIKDAGYEWDAEKKELKELKWVEQKTAWSEKDESMLSDIVKDLVHPWNEYIPDRIEEEIKWLKNKLKSLSPQSHWKPSNEQMEALKLSTYCQNEQTSKVLFKLYQDLKKLKEE